jgi:DNA-binding PadR family transcriptional regulator
MKSHENLIFSRRNETTFLPLGFTSEIGKKAEEKAVETIPKESLEKFVRGNLKLIVLSLLKDQPMCGYDVIKSIHGRYHTLVSQGTVYPLLYGMMDQGIIEVKSRDPRSKIYSLTQKGEAIVEEKIRGLSEAYQYLMKSMKA